MSPSATDATAAAPQSTSSNVQTQVTLANKVIASESPLISLLECFNATLPNFTSVSHNKESFSNF